MIIYDAQIQLNPSTEYDALICSITFTFMLHLRERLRTCHQMKYSQIDY